jgi:hypothetical protein
MIRPLLLALTFIAVFIAVAGWTYFGAAFVLFMWVYGDDSSTFGYYAIGIAVACSLVASSAFTTYAMRRHLGPRFLLNTILASEVVELPFVIRIWTRYR